MAVETLDVCVSYGGNGATTVFPYDWLITATSDISLTYTDASGVVHAVPTSYYTVNQYTNSDGSFAAGGTVTFEWSGAPIPTGSSVLISRYVLPTQSIQTNNQDGFFPEVYDGGLDRLTMVDQQLTNAVARVPFILPLGDPATGEYTLPNAAARANNSPAFDANGNPTLVPTGSGGGGSGPIVPASAPILGSTSTGSLTTVNLGTGLTLTGGTLNSTAALLPANAAVLGTDAFNNAVALTLGAGLSESAGTLTATAAPLPDNASLLSTNSGGTATAVALGSGVAINSGTLSATAATVPASAFLTGSNSGGTLVPVSVGQGLGITNYGGTLYVATPLNAKLLATGTVHGQFQAVTLGAGLTYTVSSGTVTLGVSTAAPPVSAPFIYTSSGGTLLAGTVGSGLAISGSGTLSTTVSTLPPNAAVLSTNSGGTATALALGTGLASSAGTLSATAATLPVSAAVLSTNSGGTATALVLGAGLASSAGTLSSTAASIPANAPVIASNSGGTLVSLALGAGLASAGGTLSATAATPPVSAPFLYTNSGGTLETGVVGSGLSFGSGTLTTTGGAGTVTQVVATGLLTGGTITTNGSIGLPAPSAGLVLSTGTSLITTTIGANLSLTSGTLSAAGAALQLTDGTHTATSVTDIVVSGGTLTSGTGTTTLTISGGGGSFAGGPVFGTTTTFSPPSASSLGSLISNSTAGTIALTNVSGGPLACSVALQGNGQGLTAAYQTSNSVSATVIALAETTPLVSAGNPNAFAAPIVFIGSTALIAVGFSGNTGVPQLEVRYYSTNGLTLTGTVNACPVTTKTGWLKAVLSGGAVINIYFSPNGINWLSISAPTLGTFGTISGVGVGLDGYSYYASWAGPSGATGQFIEMDLWKWSYSSP